MHSSQNERDLAPVLHAGTALLLFLVAAATLSVQAAGPDGRYLTKGCDGEGSVRRMNSRRATSWSVLM